MIRGVVVLMIVTAVMSGGETKTHEQRFATMEACEKAKPGALKSAQSRNPDATVTAVCEQRQQ
jgi:hypothetical protein